MFTGLSAFPLTPTDEVGIDERGLARLVARLAAVDVDSIGALGSTGGYAYLTREQRARAAQIAVEAAGDVPVMIGIGVVEFSPPEALLQTVDVGGARRAEQRVRDIACGYEAHARQQVPRRGRVDDRNVPEVFCTSSRWGAVTAADPRCWATTAAVRDPLNLSEGERTVGGNSLISQ